MQAARVPVRNKPQLDPDWLLGPSSVSHDPPEASQSTDNDGSMPGRIDAVASRRDASWKRWFAIGIVACGAIAMVFLVASNRIIDLEKLVAALRLPSLHGSETAEDTLRTMLELSAIATQSNADLVDHLSSNIADERTAAFQSLCSRIQGLSTNRASISQRIALVQLLQTVPTDQEDLARMRGLLASQLLQGLALNDPAIQSTRQALIAMLDTEPLHASDDSASAEVSHSYSKEAKVRVVPVERRARIAGVERLPLRELLFLTQSRQSKIVDAAIDELRRRGLDSTKIEMLFALSQADSDQSAQLAQRIHDVFGDDAGPVLEWLSMSHATIAAPPLEGTQSLTHTPSTSSNDARGSAQIETAWLASDSAPLGKPWTDHRQNKDPQE